MGLVGRAGGLGLRACALVAALVGAGIGPGTGTAAHRASTGIADVSVSQTMATGVGSTLVYSLVAANAGPGVAADVVIADTLPAGTTFVAAKSSQGAKCTAEVVCDLGRLGAAKKAFVTVIVHPVGAGQRVNHTVRGTRTNYRIWHYGGTVHFTSSDARAQLPPDYTFTANDGGAHLFTVTFGSWDTQTLTVQDTVASVSGYARIPVSNMPGRLTSWPDNLNFGRWLPGKVSEPERATLYNFGATPATINAVNIVGTNAGDFELVEGGTCVPQKVLAPDGSCYALVRFRPHSLGSLSADVGFTTSAGSAGLVARRHGRD